MRYSNRKAMNKILNIGDLREAIKDLSDNDQLVVEIHEGVRGEDLYVPTTDLIEGVRLNDGSVVNEFRLCI